jgi:hypothetical protein
MSPEQAKQQTISEYGKLYSGQSGWKKYPRLNLGGVLDTNKTEQTIPSGQAKQPQAKQPQAKEQGQQKQTEVDMDKLYEYARKLDEQSLDELKAIINEGDPEKIKKAYKRLKDKYGNL